MQFDAHPTGSLFKVILARAYLLIYSVKGAFAMKHTKVYEQLSVQA
jgi:hypothetical protein